MASEPREKQKLIARVRRIRGQVDAIERALATFQSVRRRMETKGEAGGVLVVEDFAHHPTAIRLTLEAARTRWPSIAFGAAVLPLLSSPI